MNENRRITKWDSKKKRISKRITNRQKDLIRREFEEGMAGSKKRDDVLEKLAEKYHRSDRTIERYISEAREAQEIEKRKSLKAEIYREATASAITKHWEDLASVAGELVNLWEEYQLGHPIGGYYGYIIDDPLMIELPHGKIDCLVLHLKSEFPELEKINDWKDLLKIDTPREVIIKLALVSMRRSFKGTCTICADL